MEILFVIAIVIALFGGVTIVVVLWQDDAKRSARRIADNAAPPPTAETRSTPAPAPTDHFTAAPTAQAVPQPAAAPSTESPPPSPRSASPGETPVTIETITALYAHANDDDPARVDSSLQLNVRQILAAQIEQLYDEYLKLGEERSRLSEALFTHLLFEKIERSAGRLEVATERETLNLREQLSQVSVTYGRVQFRLGSLQHLNSRLGDPRVAQQMEELMLEVKRLASKA